MKNNFAYLSFMEKLDRTNITKLNKCKVIIKFCAQYFLKILLFMIN